MEILFRPMKPEEAKEVQKVGKRAFTAFESLWVSKPKEAIVAVADGKIAGAAMYSCLESGGVKAGYVEFAFVDPVYHGQGIGGKLYRAVTECLWEQGCHAITATVKDDNVASWGLFLKNGYKRASYAEGARRLGLAGMAAQFFRTPLCISGGMDFYLAVRNRGALPKKNAGVNPILWYMAVNLLLLPFALLRRDPHGYAAFAGAYATLLAGGVLSGYIGTLFSKRKWHFRMTNGGALITAIVSLLGGLYPMVGNWYPERYEDTPGFYRDLGVSALAGWIFVLLLSTVLLVGGDQGMYFRYLMQDGAIFLLYRIFLLYPFESFGGRRVFQWKKWIYGLMSTLSAMAICLLVLAGKLHG